MITGVLIWQAKSKDKPYKVSDGGGLYLLINATGKYWRLNYRFAGRQKTLAVGVYPVVSLIDARKKREEAKALLAKNIDPSVTKALNKQAIRTAAENTFQAIALEWYAKISTPGQNQPLKQFSVFLKKISFRG